MAGGLEGCKVGEIYEGLGMGPRRVGGFEVRERVGGWG